MLPLRIAPPPSAAPQDSPTPQCCQDKGSAHFRLVIPQKALNSVAMVTGYLDTLEQVLLLAGGLLGVDKVVEGCLGRCKKREGSS